MIWYYQCAVVLSAAMMVNVVTIKHLICIRNIPIWFVLWSFELIEVKNLKQKPYTLFISRGKPASTVVLNLVFIWKAITSYNCFTIWPHLPFIQFRREVVEHNVYVILKYMWNASWFNHCFETCSLPQPQWHVCLISQNTHPDYIRIDCAQWHR